MKTQVGHGMCVMLSLPVGSISLRADDPPCMMRGDLGDTCEGCSCGACDAVTERDAWSFSVAHPMVIRMRMLVFAEDNGAEEAVSETLRNAQIEQLDTDFEDYGIQFNVEPIVINSTRFRHMCSPSHMQTYAEEVDTCCDPPAICCDTSSPQIGCDLEDYEEVKMKNLYAEEGKLNVFITGQPIGDWAIYPWSNRATTATGGIMKLPTGVGGLDCGSGESEHCIWLTHEVGHALGLWHTHEWNFQDSQCYECRERASCTGNCADPDCNLYGDLCCDTPATIDAGCASPTGQEFCSPQNDWPAADYTNYMAYGGDGCAAHFTAQQVRRMHCWACNAVPEWIDSPDCNENDIPDICEVNRGTVNDCNHNARPDSCDIADETSLDCDANGVPDECQSSTMPVKACCLHDAEGTCVETTECHCNELEGTFLHGYPACIVCAMYFSTPPEE